MFFHWADVISVDPAKFTREEAAKITHSLGSTVWKWKRDNVERYTAFTRGAVPGPIQPVVPHAFNTIVATLGPLQLRRSHISGLGLFAAETLPAEHAIVSVMGELLPGDAAQTNEERAYTWTNCKSDKYMICQFDESISNIVRYVNSSRGTPHAANCDVWWTCGGRVAFLVTKDNDIPAGQEILVDYEV